MDLTAYLAAMRALIAPTTNEVAVYSDAMLTAGLKQALREYEESLYPVQYALAAVAGRTQGLTLVPDLVDLVAVVWPWDSAAAWKAEDLARHTVRWRWVQAATIYIEDGEPKAGDQMLLFYRKKQKIQGLENALQTTVWAEHESLLVLGAAGWSVEVHYRQTSEALKAPPSDQIKRMYTWSYLRLNEFRNGLRDLGRAGTGPVRPNWGRIGL